MHLRPSWCLIAPWFVLVMLILPARGVEAWFKVSAEDGLVYSNGSKQDAQDFALGYNAYQKAFREFFGVNHLPTRIVLFRSAKALDQFFEKSSKPGFHYITFHAEVDGGLVIALSLGDGLEEGLHSMYEFQTEHGLERAGYRMPLWIALGSGEVFSTLQLTRKGIVIGKIRDNLSDALYEYPYMGWDRFYAVDSNSGEYRDSVDLTHGIYYAQSWTLMHWILLSDDRGAERFKALVMLSRRMPGADAVTKVMGTSPDGTEAAIKRHFSKDEGRRIIPFDEAATRSRLQPVPAPEAEVKATLVDLLVAAQKDAEANAMLDRAQALAPDSSAVNEALARRELRRGNTEEAINYYQKAIAGGSRNAWAYYYSAKGRIERQASAPGNPESEANITAAIAELKRVIEFQPDIDFYRMLGRALALTKKASLDDIEVLNQATSVGMPEQELWNLRAEAYVRMGEVDKAIADFRAIAGDRREPTERRRSALMRVEAMEFSRCEHQVEALVGEGKYAEAREVVNRAQARASRAAVGRYDSLHATIDEAADGAELTRLCQSQDWAKFRPAADAFSQKYPESDLVQKLSADPAVAVALKATP